MPNGAASEDAGSSNLDLLRLGYWRHLHLHLRPQGVQVLGDFYAQSPNLLNKMFVYARWQLSFILSAFSQVILGNFSSNRFIVTSYAPVKSSRG